MLLPLLRLLCVSLCSEAVFSHSHDSGQQQQQKTKGTFTPGDYESTATNRNVHKARSGSGGASWRAAAAAAAREDRGVVNGNNARAQQQHQHQHLLHDATLNSVARRGASRAVRKTQHPPKKGPRGAGRAEDGDGGGGEGPWHAPRGEAAAAAAMATHGRRGCSHGKSDANYPIKSNKKHEQMCRRKKAAYSRQRRDVKGGQGDGEAMWEALPKPLAQEQGMDFQFNESSDYEQFTLPNIFDFIPKNTNNKRKVVRNPFYPVTAESYGAYALVIFAGMVFVVGILGNIAIMCIVCHNYYMRSISNSLLANLAFWDFVVIFFCLPLVTFHELTKNWLLGEFSCKVIPYIEVVSLGVTTFTLCALCIDRFRAATNVQMYYEMIENCCSTGAKLAVIWVGALLLALPEILIRQLVVEDGEPPDMVPRERCVVRISTELPDTLYVLGLTYDGARLWWYFGCYFCLPTLFTICCSLVTARKIRKAERAAVRGTKKQIHLESQMNCVVVALAILYGFCIIPENICNIVSVYMAASVPRRALDILHLVSQLLLFCKSAVTPVLLLFLCQPFSRAFLDCCCCCCAECASDPSPRRTSSTAATTTSDNECTTTELELSPFSTIRRDVSSPYASVGTHC